MSHIIELGTIINVGCSTCGQQAEVAIVVRDEDGCVLEISETACALHRGDHE